MSLLATAVNWSTIHKDALLSLVGGAAGISVILATVLLKVKTKWTAFAETKRFKKLAYTLLHVFTIVTTLATYWLANVPKGDLLPIYATLTIAAQTWHRFVISGFFSRVVVPFLQWQSTQKTTTLGTSTTVATDVPADALD